MHYIWLKGHKQNSQIYITYLGCVSLLKSKSGFLTQKRLIEPNDRQRNWVLKIISKTGYLSVSLLRQKE